MDDLLKVSYQRSNLGDLPDVLDATVYVLLTKKHQEFVHQRVFGDLRRFPTWKRLATAQVTTIKRLLEPTGFGQQRSVQLKDFLREVDRRNRQLCVGPYGSEVGDLTLEFLRSWSKDSAKAFLEGLPGIGPKSAQCIASYALSEDRCTVDSHVRRILVRLGIVANGLGKPEPAALETVVPKNARIRLHVNLANHARAVCRESAPRCGSCSLISFCETGRSRVAAAAGSEAVVDLFGGAGAMGLGFERAGFRIAASVEIERHAAQTYRLNHPGVPVLEAAVEDISGDSLRSWLPGLDVPAAVIAGPPCQGYSAAGARTIGDQRNLLFRNVSRLARELGARSVLIENVPGIRRVNGVGYVEQITRSLRNAGYVTWDQPADLRASDFGVPQNRRRLFFVGVHPGGALPKVPTPTHRQLGQQGAYLSLPRTPSLIERLQDLPNLGPGEGAERLQLADGRVVLNSTVMRHSPEVVAKIKAILPGGGPISYRRLEGDVARTLVAGHRALPVHPTQHRTITVREAARIQGFPDSYFFCGPRASQPLQVANAVPPRLAQAVAEELKVSLNASKRLRDEASAQRGA